MGSHTVHVTQADIDRAVTKSSSRCVAARAIARTIPNASCIGVDVQTVRFTVEGERQVYLCPPVVAGYVVAFDAGETIHPFSFRLLANQMVPVQVRKSTPAGKKKNATRAKVRYTTANVTKAQKAVVTAPPAKKADAKKALAAAQTKQLTAKEERQNVIAAYKGQASTQPVDKNLRPTIPQVFKRNTRSYGMRQLRINQP